jgi:hypothetical protein
MIVPLRCVLLMTFELLICVLGRLLQLKVFVGLLWALIGRLGM